MNSINVGKELLSNFYLANRFLFTLSTNFKEALKSILIYKIFYKKNFYENLRKIIWTCLPIATLSVAASSVIYAIHVAPAFSTRGLTMYFGGGVALALIRESVPVLGSLALVTQYCSGATAEIGSMKITEQLDAMRISRVSPISYILVPMLIAGLIGFPIVITISTLVGIAVNFFATNCLIDITYRLYTSSISHVVQFKDIFLALIKSSVFGFMVTLVSYTCGVLTTGGAKAVGNSTRLSVVINFALIIILDYIITALWL